MSNAISLTPGFSPVTRDANPENRFNGFPPAGKPLKRLASIRRPDTRLKPGVNETESAALPIFVNLVNSEF